MVKKTSKKYEKFGLQVYLNEWLVATKIQF